MKAILKMVIECEYTIDPSNYPSEDLSAEEMLAIDIEAAKKDPTILAGLERLIKVSVTGELLGEENETAS